MQTLDFSVRGCLRAVAARPALTLISRNMLTLGCLTRQQKSLDQLTLAANCHPGESLVPLALGCLGLAVKPLRQQF